MKKIILSFLVFFIVLIFTVPTVFATSSNLIITPIYGTNSYVSTPLTTPVTSTPNPSVPILKFFPNASRVDGVMLWDFINHSLCTGPSYDLVKFYGLVTISAQLGAETKGSSFLGIGPSIYASDIFTTLKRPVPDTVIALNPSIRADAGYVTGNKHYAVMVGINVINVDTSKVYSWIGSLFK
jgi:hypothetical protein